MLFEVLSCSNIRKDQAWRREVYASIPNCQHYVTLEQKRAVAICYDRADGWKGRTIKGLGESLALPALAAGLVLPARVYRFTPVATKLK